MKTIKMFFLVIYALIAGSIVAQDAVRINLKLNKNYNGNLWRTFDILEGKDICEFGKRDGKNISGIITRIYDKSNAVLLKIDTNKDTSFEGEKEYKLLPDSSVIINIKTTYSNKKTEWLPYTFRYRCQPNSNANQPSGAIDCFYNYVAEGKVKIYGKFQKIEIFDTNYDGKFDFNDLGSSIRIGNNGNAAYYGYSEVIDFNDYKYTVVIIEEDCSSITLIKNNKSIIKGGDKIGKFTLETIDNKKVTRESLKGKVFLLDFWAPWCHWCMAAWPEIHKEKIKYPELEVITICADIPDRFDVANKILKEKKLKWNNVILKGGLQDPFWKEYGNIGDNKCNLPLYILVDQNGIIRYYGSGSSFRGINFFDEETKKVETKIIGKQGELDLLENKLREIFGK